jgi:hypothetical protein
LRRQRITTSCRVCEDVAHGEASVTLGGGMKMVALFRNGGGGVVGDQAAPRGVK